MKFKKWIIGEMSSFSLQQPQPIKIMVGDGPSGPFHPETISAVAFDMRFEDYAIEGDNPPTGNWAAPLADGRFIVFNNSTHQAVINDTPTALAPNKQPIPCQVIRNDWARFAEIFGPGYIVVKPAQYDRGVTGTVQHKSTNIPIQPVSKTT